MSCPICEGKDINVEGIKLADKEVIPFFKKLLNLRYVNHPFPPKYVGLSESLMCYSQALLFNRVHSIQKATFYTSNKWMLKFGYELAEEFGMTVDHEKNKPDSVSEVCEFNIDT